MKKETELLIKNETNFCVAVVGFYITDEEEEEGQQVLIQPGQDWNVEGPRSPCIKIPGQITLHEGPRDLEKFRFRVPAEERTALKYISGGNKGVLIWRYKEE